MSEKTYKEDPAAEGKVAVLKEREGYIHLKVKITKDFYIPVADDKLIDDEQKFAKREAIKRAIARNINGFQWSGSHIDYQRQDEIVDPLSVSSGSNVIYVEDVNK